MVMQYFRIQHAHGRLLNRKSFFRGTNLTPQIFRKIAMTEHIPVCYRRISDQRYRLGDTLDFKLLRSEMKPSAQQCNREDIEFPLFPKHFDERFSHLRRNIPVDMTGIIAADVFAQFDEIVPLSPKHGGVVSDTIPDDLATGFEKNLSAVFH